MTDKYLVYDTKADADKAMSDVWEAYKADMEAKGFPIINGEIVPKNAATNLPDYEAQRTIAYDNPSEAIDGTFVIKDPPVEFKTAITIQPTKEVPEIPVLKGLETKPEIALNAIEGNPIK